MSQQLKTLIDDNIYENQNGEITGEKLNIVLNAMVDEIDSIESSGGDTTGYYKMSYFSLNDTIKTVLLSVEENTRANYISILDLVKLNDNQIELVATILSTIRGYTNNTSELVNDTIAVGVALDIKYNFWSDELYTKREIMQQVTIDENGTTILDALLQNEITEEEFYTIS